MRPSTLRLATLCLSPAAALLGGCDSLNRAAGVPVHFASHQLCSAVFVAGLDPSEFYQQGIAPQIAPAGPLLSYAIDLEHSEATGTFAGLVNSRAVYRGPLGCLVLHGEAPPPATLETRAAEPSLLPPIAGPEPVAPTVPPSRPRSTGPSPSPPVRRIAGRRRSLSSMTVGSRPSAMRLVSESIPL